MSGGCCQELVPLKHGGVCGPITDAPIEEINDGKQHNVKRKCGCLKTSTKIKKVLRTFPTPPPPTPVAHANVMKCDKASGYTYGHGESKLPNMPCMPKPPSGCCPEGEKQIGENCQSWKIVSELVSVVQLTVTAAALALYYLIYCYMQIVYFTLRSAMFFLKADGPMKVTIGVVTATALIIAFNLLMRIERLLSLIY